MRFILIAACLFLLLPSCRHSSCCEMPLTEMVRMQTQCADAWGYGKDNNETVTILSKYLSQKQIIPSKIELQSTWAEVVCNACTCSRGFVFHVWVQSQYVSGLTAQGFTIQ
jgi:hypothetical protein